MDLFKQIIHVDFIAIVTFIYLALFMRANMAYDKSVNKYFVRSLTLLAVLTAADNLDYFFSGLSEPYPIHKVFIMAGYITRVFLLVSAVFLLKRDSITKRAGILLFAPAILNAAVILSAFFNDKVFWIDENNVLHREALSYTPHAVSLIYFFIVLAMTVKRYRQGYKDEGRLLFVALASIMTGVVSEIVLKTRGVLISAILLMLAFYYLYLHMEHFKRDTLTGVLNRMSFFADIEDTQRGNITALCEIDMNGLKEINDTQGHEAGDKAIKNISSIILKSLPNSSHLYRLGGDEFAVLFRSIDTAEIENVISSLRSEIEKSPYSCAIGLAEWDSQKTFSEIYNLADKRMYEDKKRQKALLQKAHRRYL